MGGESIAVAQVRRGVRVLQWPRSEGRHYCSGPSQRGQHYCSGPGQKEGGGGGENIAVAQARGQHYCSGPGRKVNTMAVAQARKEGGVRILQWPRSYG